MIIKCFSHDNVDSLEKMDSQFLTKTILDYATKNGMIKNHINRKLELSIELFKERITNLNGILNKINDKLDNIQKEKESLSITINSNINSLKMELNKNI